MKMLIALLIFSSSIMAAPSVSKNKNAEKKEVVKTESKAEEKKAEDCDEKAKKPIEITPEAFTLGSGTAGCSLDEAH